MHHESWIVPGSAESITTLLQVKMKETLIIVDSKHSGDTYQPSGRPGRHFISCQFLIQLQNVLFKMALNRVKTLATSITWHNSAFSLLLSFFSFSFFVFKKKLSDGNHVICLCGDVVYLHNSILDVRINEGSGPRALNSSSSVVPWWSID